jgi:sec-independent protein translocase protein TatB
MFDIAWSEMIVIGAVALIAIGPKDLPKALRAVGAMTAKARRMASEFQEHFREAMREAELESVKEEVANLNRDLASATSGMESELNTINSQMPSSSTATALPVPQTSSDATAADIPGLPPPSEKSPENAPPEATSPAVSALEPARAEPRIPPEAAPAAAHAPSTSTAPEEAAAPSVAPEEKKVARRKRAPAKPKAASTQVPEAATQNGAAEDAAIAEPELPLSAAKPVKLARKRAAKAVPSGDDPTA